MGDFNPCAAYSSLCCHQDGNILGETVIGFWSEGDQHQALALEIASMEPWTDGLNFSALLCLLKES